MANLAPLILIPIVVLVLGLIIEYWVIQPIRNRGRPTLTPQGPPLLTTIEKEHEASLALVDLRVLDSDEYPILDLKLRNPSPSPAFITQANFHLIGKWTIERLSLYPAAFPVTWTYDTSLPENVGGVSEHALSQVIDPFSIDRFALTVGSSQPQEAPALYLHLFTVELIYNEDHRVLRSPPILIHVPPSVRVEGQVVAWPSSFEVAHNRKTATEVLSSLPGDVITGQTVQAVAPTGFVQIPLLDAIKFWVAPPPPASGT